jgi:YidC/Oxa1 family membrane protein insertase
MEKRVLVAIVLSFLVLVLYQVVFFKKKPQSEIPSERITEIEKKPAQQPYTQELPEKAKTIQEKEQPGEVISSQFEEDILIDTSLYRATWSNKGAVLKSWKLKKHKGKYDEESGYEDLDMVSRRASEINIFPFSLRTDDSSFDAHVNSSLYQSSNSSLDLTGGQAGELRFQYADDQGTRVEKILTFQDGKYDFDIQINVWKYGQTIHPKQPDRS